MPILACNHCSAPIVQPESPQVTQFSVDNVYLCTPCAGDLKAKVSGLLDEYFGEGHQSVVDREFLLGIELHGLPIRKE
jgi:hypothetical protein